MDPETKKNALDKAEAIDEFVAYPNELLDASMVDDYYVSLRLDEDADYFESVLHLAKFLCDKNFEKLHVPVNKSDWVTHGRAAVVNAFYNLVENSIQFPAGKSVSRNLEIICIIFNSVLRMFCVAYNNIIIHSKSSTNA